MAFSEQEQFRRKSLDELNKLSINPYPADLFEVNVTTIHILESYSAKELKDVSIAGSLMNCVDL